MNKKNIEFLKKKKKKKKKKETTSKNFFLNKYVKLHLEAILTSLVYLDKLSKRNCFNADLPTSDFQISGDSKNLLNNSRILYQQDWKFSAKTPLTYGSMF